MARPDVNSFQRALNKFKKSLSPDLINQFSVCTLQDVQQICRDIQQDQGSDGNLQYMRRLDGFIEAMENLGKVMEVFLNAHNFVCFIWGPVKLLLGIARTYLDSLDKLLGVYSQLGDAIPGLLCYQATFEKHPSLAMVLEDYYSDILVFHQAAISVFKTSRWQKMFRSTWKTFDSEFRPILQSLTNRRELLESEKGSATLYEIQRLREDFADAQAEQKGRMIEKHRKRVSQIRHNLQAPNYQIDQEISTENRNGNISGMWMMGNVSFQKWSNENEFGHGVLYVNGIPGAGKTTLMSSVIQQLLNDKASKSKKCSVAYFYFKNEQTNKKSHNSVLRAMLDQLIDQDPNMSDHLFEGISFLNEVNLRSTKELEEMVKGVLECYQISYLVLDGLDECSSNERAETIKWFLSLTNGGLDPNSAVLRILFCGQRDGVVDKLLDGHTSIEVHTSGHVEDIRQYCRGFCERIQKKFAITTTERDAISSRVSEESKGMFLYARVVLENLLSQTRRSGLRQEMEPGTFPQGLEKAYERVCRRIFKTPSSAERRDATKILGSVICARRPLRWREIQSLFCIDPANGVVDYEDRLRVTCKELCGSLVDLHHMINNKPGPEAIIQIVHETAQKYIMREKWLDAIDENARLAIFCSQYLISEPFRYGISEDDIEKYASKGYYSFQDYAVKYWLDHLQECAKSGKARDQQRFEEAMEFAHDVLDSYGESSMIGDYGTKSQHLEISRALLRLPEDATERNTYLNIELRIKRIRKGIETLQDKNLDAAVREILTNLHGTEKPYKCSKPWCELFTVGFECDEDRRHHLNEHELPHCCPVEDCFASQLGYATLSQLEQHNQKKHSHSDDGFRFPDMAKKPPSMTTAAMRGDTAAVEAFLDVGWDINSPNGPKGKGSPLYLAASHGHFEVCALLLKRGADINFAGPGVVSRRTTLHAAVTSNKRDLVRLFVSQPDCLLDIVDSKGRTPFCEACALGDLEIVKLLLATGKIQPESRPVSHPGICKGIPHNFISTSTPLGYACIEGHLHVVQYLLQQGNFPDKDIRVRVAMLRHRAVFDLLREEIAKMPRDQTQGYSYFKDPLGFRKDGDGWWVVLNEDVPATIDVDLFHTLHLVGARCVCFSADGKYVAIGTSSRRTSPGVAEIYDTTTGEIVPIFQDEHEIVKSPWVTTVCFSPDGKCLAIGTFGGQIRIWDIASKTTKHVFAAHQNKNAIDGLFFSPNGRTIVSSGDDDAVYVWNIDTSEKVLSITASETRVTSAATISPDARYVAAGCLDGNVRVWDLETGAITALLADAANPHGRVSSVSFSPSGRELFSGGSDKRFKMWELDGSRGEHLDPITSYGGYCVKDFQSHAGSITCVAVTPDSEWVLTGSEDQCLRFLDPKTGHCQLLLGGFHEGVISVAVSPKGGYFATCTGDGGVRVWSYSTPTPLSSII